ncbi:MAG: hypothetical protein FWH17_09435 [Oscillospiraceae bacterium]|nr:hypothetical protein [Oscillospiraceae bacterium]
MKNEFWGVVRRGGWELWAAIIAAVIKIIPRAEHGCGASDRLRMDERN